MTEETGASHGPLNSPPADSLIESALRIELKGARQLWHGFTLADLAHLYMLQDAELIPGDAFTSLVDGLLTLEETPPEDEKLEPAVGDIYRNREKRLDRHGAETGWLGLGRPRREASTLAYQLTARRLSLELFDSILNCIDSIVDLSRDHVSTLMPDYTYNQRAQPTVFGHYLLGFAPPLLRDLDRLKTAFNHLNRSPAGTGSTNGSRLNLNRTVPIKLLGFDAPVEHARDAMWQSDGPIELSSLLVSVTTTLGRLANDLQLFSTQEFNFVELADEYSRASVLMPQKKNPYSLAFVRGVAGEINGLVPSMASAGKTTTGQVDNRQFPYHRIPEALDLVNRTTRLIADVLDTLTVKEDSMRQAAEDQFNASTDLAEYLVESYGVDYRSAHEIVGESVRRLQADNPDANTFSPDVLNNVLQQFLEDDDIQLSPDELNQVVDPENVVKSRTTPGGASAEQLQTLFDSIEDSHDSNQQWFRNQQELIESAENSLLASARNEIDDE